MADAYPPCRAELRLSTAGSNRVLSQARDALGGLAPLCRPSWPRHGPAREGVWGRVSMGACPTAGACGPLRRKGSANWADGRPKHPPGPCAEGRFAWISLGRGQFWDQQAQHNTTQAAPEHVDGPLPMSAGGRCLGVPDLDALYRQAGAGAGFGAASDTPHHPWPDTTAPL